MIFILSCLFSVGCFFGVYYWPPRKLLDILSNYLNVHCFITTRYNLVALTIDDSPSPNTLAIADMLNSANHTATFFVIGDHIQKYDPQLQILCQLLLDGHELGNHTFRDVASIRLSDEELKTSIRQTQELIDRAYQLVGRRQSKRWFRPGCGFITKRMSHIVEEMGFTTALASCYPHDCQIKSSFVNNLYIRFRAIQGDIIVIHDRSSSLSLLPRVLPFFTDMEIHTSNKLTTLSDLWSKRKLF